MNPKHITAIVITRGNVDMTEILESLPYPDVQIVTRVTEGDHKILNRYLAIADTDTPFLYYQDDDIVFTRHKELMEAHGNRTDLFTSNMPSPWWDQMYADKAIALTGAGCIMPRELPWKAFGHYLTRYPCDELFEIYCDLVMGGLTPYHRIDLGFKILPCASDPGRIWTTPGQIQRKAEIVRRIFALRKVI